MIKKFNNFVVKILKSIYMVFSNKYLIKLVNIVRMKLWSIKLEHLGNKSSIRPYVVINAPDKVSIGNNVSIAEFVHMWGGGGIEIGNNVLIASHSIITSQTHDVNASMYNSTQIRKKIIIKENVWIGSGAIIMPGVTIGNGSIVAAGAIVTKNVPDRVIVVGSPARVMRKLPQHDSI